jgi:phosphatidylglycerophosphate synthase
MKGALGKESTQAEGLRATIIGGSDVRLWGMSLEERLRRSLVRAGVAVADEREAAGAQLLLRGDHVFDDALVADLARTPSGVLVGADGAPIAANVGHAAHAAVLAEAMAKGGKLPGDLGAALRVLAPAELSSAYRRALRKRETPYVFRLQREDERTAVERAMFGGAYKGVTDFVTKYLWPEPAFWVTRACAATGVSPNAVTWASLLLVVAAFFLFLKGYFLSGLVAAWLMTFLDTVDGKLARVTLTSTKLGDVFDHGIDLVHPPFWYAAWLAGLHAVGLARPDEILLFVIVVGGYVLGRLQEGLFLWLFRIEIHVWEAIDSRFRLVTARRNPNLFLLTIFALVGRPDLGMVAVAVWTALSLLFHFIRIGQALHRRRMQGPLVSWLAAP